MAKNTQFAAGLMIVWNPEYLRDKEAYARYRETYDSFRPIMLRGIDQWTNYAFRRSFSADETLKPPADQWAAVSMRYAATQVKHLLASQAGADRGDVCPHPSSGRLAV